MVFFSLFGKDGSYCLVICMNFLKFQWCLHVFVRSNATINILPGTPNQKTIPCKNGFASSYRGRFLIIQEIVILRENDIFIRFLSMPDQTPDASADDGSEAAPRGRS